MQPGDGFWDGVGASVGTSPGWMIVIAIFGIGVLFIIAKYIVPSRERVSMRKLDIREKEADNDRERIESNRAIAEQQGQTNLMMDGMRRSLDNSSARLDVVVAEIHSSRDGSQKMGDRVEGISTSAKHTEQVVEDTNAKVTEMHAQTRDIYAILNKRGVEQNECES